MSRVRMRLEPFSVTSEERDTAAYLRVSGEIDMATVPVLDERLLAAQSNGYAGIVVDLEQVTFMDATGLRSLLRAAGRARRDNKTFSAVKTPAIVDRMLKITGTAHLLDADPFLFAPSRDKPG